MRGSLLLLSATALAVLATAACTAAPAAELTTPATNPAIPTTTAVPVPEESIGESTAPPTNQKPPSQKPDCLGAVTYTIDNSRAGPIHTPRCITVGALLRVTSHGPEGFSSGPDHRVSCQYEGGVHECRLIRTGYASFTITRAGGPQSFTVDISAATTPPRPSSACLGAVTFTVDLSFNGPPWPAICMKRTGTVRVESFGPEGFSVDPPANVSCWYEAAVRECQLVKTGTVEFTTVSESETRTLVVVVIA